MTFAKIIYLDDGCNDV